MGKVPVSSLKIGLEDPLFRLLGSEEHRSITMPAPHGMEDPDELFEGVFGAPDECLRGESAERSSLSPPDEASFLRLVQSLTPSSRVEELSPAERPAPEREQRRDELGPVPHCTLEVGHVEQSPDQIEQAWLQLNAAELCPSEKQEATVAVTSITVKESLARLEQSVEGFIGAAVADSDSGMCLGWTGGAGIVNIEVAAAGNTEVVRAKRKTMKTLGLRDEIEDMLITLSKQYHLIRPLRTRPSVFFYLAVDRARANLAMARFALADAERELGS